MIGGLFAVGLLVSVFTGINTGGSSIGESFGPTVGSGVVSTRAAAALMSVSVLIGGLTLGRNVVETLGHGFVPQDYFTLPAAIGVLLFTGLGILLGNLREVSVSTTETAVGAVAGMGAAFGVLDWGTAAAVVTWWLVSPVVAFWVSGVVGRYLYHRIEDRLDLSEGSRSTAETAVVLAIACYMGFSAGASNVANAVAPLIGAGVLRMVPGVLLGAAAMAIGAFLIGPRTMETVGDEITDLSLAGALLVEVVAATVITLLNWAGIPASLAVTAVTCVIGLGWGRATRHADRGEGLGPGDRDRSVADGGDEVATTPDDLFSAATTRRVVATWLLSPAVAAVLSFGCFEIAVATGLLTA